MTFELRVRALRSRERELQRRVAEELAQVKVLRGLLPTCAWCRKVRDDAGYWTQIEAYVAAHSEAEFTHGICPECKDKYRRGQLKESPLPRIAPRLLAEVRVGTLGNPQLPLKRRAHGL